MVVLVNEVHKVCSVPKKCNWECIAEKIVNKYPESFKDLVGEVVIGNGRQSIVSQLLFRSGNVTKSCRNFSKKRNYEDIVSSDNNKELEEMQNALKSQFFIKDHDKNEVRRLMKETYPLQRRHIKKMLLICELKQHWLFLFEESYRYFFDHFAILTKTENPKDEFVAAMSEKGIKIFQ